MIRPEHCEDCRKVYLVQKLFFKKICYMRRLFSGVWLPKNMFSVKEGNDFSTWRWKSFFLQLLNFLIFFITNNIITKIERDVQRIIQLF